MKIDQAISVIFSPCGGTKHVLDAIAKEISLPRTEYDVTLPQNRKNPLRFSANDLVFLGFPVYGGRAPRNAPAIFEQLSGDDTPTVVVAVYGNRDYDGALLDLHKLAVQRGFRPVAASAAVAEHSMTPAVAAGCPDKADEAALAQFGQDVLNRLKMSAFPETIEAPGTYPNLKVPPASAFLIEADPALCTECGVCFKACPNEAISEKDLKHTNFEKCILCTACIKYCPERARGFPNPAVRQMGAEHLKEAAVKRREAAFFFSVFSPVSDHIVT